LDAITYLKSKQRAVCEMSRVLKPDGTAIPSFLNKVSLAKCFYTPILAKRRLQKMMGKESKKFKRSKK